MKREYYIDNLRFMAVLLLFPYHTFMIYNSYGESFYIKGEYLKERVKKLFVPFMIRMLVLVPVQAFYAQKFHFGFKGSLLQQYGIFFLTCTDFTGYDGSFTTGHLWFLLYLFIISIIALPIMMCLGKDRQPMIQMFLISAGSVMATFGIYELLRRMKNQFFIIVG